MESVYAMFEVKTTLSPDDIADSVSKCRRFKAMQRRFLAPTSLGNSLFVIWAFNAPAPVTLKANLAAALSDVPRPSNRISSSCSAESWPNAALSMN
jgi:hypothetical protein